MIKVLFLGTGSSTGVPMIECKCDVCLSKSKYNKRLRSSILINFKNKNILVDCGPDFRQQALKYKINKIDYLILTHAHFDHISGLDEIRAYNRKFQRKIPCYLLRQTYNEVKEKFSHFFKTNKEKHSQSAQFDFHILDKDESYFFLENEKINYFSYYQDSKKVLGFRLKNFAYLTDIKRYKKNIFDYLHNLDVLILGCLRKKSSPVHFHLYDAIGFAKKVNAKKTYLIHLGHEMDYQKVSSALPKNIFLSYDDLKLKID